jgi:hypothetical protein
MGLFGAGAFSPEAFANASSILNGGGDGGNSEEERLRKLLAQLRGGRRDGQAGGDPYGVGKINVTDPNRYSGGGLMNFFHL